MTPSGQTVRLVKLLAYGLVNLPAHPIDNWMAERFLSEFTVTEKRKKKNLKLKLTYLKNV